ncbi:MAG TPA: GNAT family N-acetyltransferase [Chloroflexota bacterium]|nr:GNAT family N-acetyltransferase [Chloroflexota bacterium]
MRIEIDDLSGEEIAAFLHEHLSEVHSVGPPESQHALDIEGLRSPEVTLWAAREGDRLVGCGALKRLDATHAELKSMRTAPARRRSGVASALLEHVIAEAKRRGYSRLSLETGSFDLFEPARRLYLKYGFDYCKPFADYAEDPNSVFMTRLV